MEHTDEDSPMDATLSMACPNSIAPPCLKVSLKETVLLSKPPFGWPFTLPLMRLAPNIGCSNSVCISWLCYYECTSNKLGESSKKCTENNSCIKCCRKFLLYSIVKRDTKHFQNWYWHSVKKMFSVKLCLSLHSITYHNQQYKYLLQYFQQKYLTYLRIKKHIQQLIKLNQPKRKGKDKYKPTLN